MARFNLSPSRIARFYFHECDRYLRYAAATKEQRAVDGIPPIELDHNLVTKAVLESGYAWECEIVESMLGDRAVIADVGGPLHERRHSVDETLAALAEAVPGTVIYQPTLRAPDSFYAAYGLDPELVRLVDCHPDLVMVDRFDTGIELRVVDAKASSEMKLAHRIQTALYTLLLRHAVADAGLDFATSRLGGIWLYGQSEPEWFELARIAPQLETFLAHDLTPMLETPAAEAFWHVAFRCEWCDYYDHCRAEADANDNVSLVPYLSTFGKRHLHDVAGVATVRDLARMLDQPDRDSLLAGSASLEGTARELQLAVEALTTGEERPTGAASVGMPVGEQVRLVLTLQSEPVSGALYGYAINRVFGRDLFGNGAETIARVATDPSADAVAALRRDLVHDLSRILRVVHDHNVANSEWRDQKALQAYVFDSYERELLVEALLQAVDEPDIAQDALALLFHFQHPDLAGADEHPATEVFFPLVVLTSVIRNLLALPIPVAYRFADVVAAVRPSDHAFDYRHDDFWCFALSNRMKSNAIFEVWNRRRDDLVVAIERELQRRVWAAGSVINGLRERLDGTGALFAWPPKFFLPAGFGFADPLLSRLAFITRYEEVLKYLQVRSTRTRPADERFAVGDSFLLHSDGGNDFRLDNRHAEHGLAPDDFLNWILTLDDDAGRHARLAYDDFVYRNAVYAPKNRPVALARIRSVADDGGVRLELATRDAWVAPRQDERCVLEPRYTDWLSHHVVTELAALDEQGSSWFAQLVADPAGTRAPVPTPQRVRDRALALAEKHEMTPSQRAAFEGMLDFDLQLVWGPPGTGKTHFLALALLCLLEAHREAGQPYHMLVSGFTNAAIDNCLDKIDALQAQRRVVGGSFELRKLNGETARVSKLDAKSAAGFCVRYPLAIVGATVWQARKTPPEDLRYDVVVIDEGSQLTVADSALAVRRLKTGGRLVIAGDDRQLPPIVQGDYPEKNDEPVLHRSILECLRGRDDTGAPVTSLLENFRMCDVLCEYPRRSIYPDEYRPATTAIADARLVFDGVAGSTEPDPELARFLALVLDPRYPAITCVVGGVKATAENQTEAALVADLATELRRLLCDGDDEEFWHERLFVVSPHNAQLRAIRRELAFRRTWGADPFVGTVDRMQGQECDAVIVSYGVSDVEYALEEKEFIYSLNRLNVAMTRARMKSIVLLSRSLLEPPIQALERDDVADGIAFMQGYARFCENGSDPVELALNGVSISVHRA